MSETMLNNLPTITEVLADTSTSYWLRKALLSAIRRDTINAAEDAELLARLLNRACTTALGRLTRVEDPNCEERVCDACKPAEGHNLPPKKESAD